MPPATAAVAASWISEPGLCAARDGRARSGARVRPAGFGAAAAAVPGAVVLGLGPAGPAAF